MQTYSYVDLGGVGSRIIAEMVLCCVSNMSGGFFCLCANLDKHIQVRLRKQTTEIQYIG